MMMSENLNPTREFKIAAAYTALALLLLWAIGHPVREWTAIAIVLYIALRLTRVVIAGAVAYAARRLAGYGRRVLHKYGVPPPDDRADGPAARHSKTVLTAVLATLVMFSTGAGLTAGFQIALMYGLSPFPSYLHWTAGALLATGALGVAAALGVPAFVFAMADIRRQGWGTGAAHLQPIAEGIARRRGWRVAA